MPGKRTLLDVVVGERAAILELFAREDEALLVRRDPCEKVSQIKLTTVPLGEFRRTTFYAYRRLAGTK